MTTRIRADQTEQTQKCTPSLSLFLAYAAMLPPVLGAAAFWLAPATSRAFIDQWEALYGGALLCFFAGVRRGLSFRQAGGPAFEQIGGMIWLFGLGVVTLIAAARPSAMLLPMIGFLSMILTDERAAANKQAPLYFGRLRRVQMWVPVLSLASCLAGLHVT